MIRRLDAAGYVIIGGAFEHRMVAETTMGRPLAVGECVHHKNRDRADNRPENLQVLTTAEHIELHRREGKRRGNRRKSPTTSPSIDSMWRGRRRGAAERVRLYWSKKLS